MTVADLATPGATMLTPRWRPLRYHAEQYRLWRSTARFRVVPAGRRSGKTELAKRFIVLMALISIVADARFVLAAPTRDQAKKIFWKDLKRMVPGHLVVGKPSETELTIQLVNGAEIAVVGMDRPERIEGAPLDGIVLDEYASMHPEAWGEHVRPALSDRNGWGWLIGVPEGRNHYYDLYVDARSDTSGEWGTFTWKSAEILPASEVDSARRSLDPLTFEQEYEATFLSPTGRAYYSFDAETHAKEIINYTKSLPLIFTMDFNTSPGTAGVLQEVPGKGTCVIDEIFIPKNSVTPRVCKLLAEKWKGHRGQVFCYGDATGGAGGSAKVAGSDWDLVRATLKPVFGDRLFVRVDAENPRERVRLNAMNTRIKRTDGATNLWVSRDCKYTIKDFEGTQLEEDGSGEISKPTGTTLTHLTDGIGYYVTKKFPLNHGRLMSQSQAA